MMERPVSLSAEEYAACSAERIAPIVLENDLVFPEKTDVPAVLSKYFSRYVQVFGVHLFATSACQEWFVQHVARSLAKFLDQDEDGHPEHPEVVREMVNHKAAMGLYKSEREYSNGIGKIADEINSTLLNGIIKNDHPIWNCSVVDVWVVAEIFEEETPHDATEPYGMVPPGPPWGRDDAVFEEVFHLITHVGYGCAWQDIWGFRAQASRQFGYPSDVPASNISFALDVMLGDCGAAYNHTQVPKHKGCNYYYDADSCMYPCLVNEYLNFAHLAYIGARDYQYNDHKDEYSFCTHTLCKKHDRLGYRLASDTSLPELLPSGHYRPKNRTSVLALGSRESLVVV